MELNYILENFFDFKINKKKILGIFIIRSCYVIIKVWFFCI